MQIQNKHPKNTFVTIFVKNGNEQDVKPGEYFS